MKLKELKKRGPRKNKLTNWLNRRQMRKLLLKKRPQRSKPERKLSQNKEKMNRNKIQITQIMWKM
jgi:hypothetical protein